MRAHRLCIVFVLAAVSVPVLAEDSDAPLYGSAKTLRPTQLLRRAAPDATALRQLPAGEFLRWVDSERRDGFLRVLQSKGPIGWARESDLANATPPAVPAVAEATKEACHKPLSSCPASGCENNPNSDHALLNEQKRLEPPSGGKPVLLTLEDFQHLQVLADDRVGQGQPLTADDRNRLKDLDTSTGKISEGAVVQIVAYLADGPGDPRASSGESVNCRLSGQANNDFHIPVVAAVDGTEYDGIVTEMIPQARRVTWTLPNLKKVKAAKHQVLITGLLLYDNMHVVNDDPDSTSKQPKRISLWEIHRITEFKVCAKATGICDTHSQSGWQPLGHTANQ